MRTRISRILDDLKSDDDDIATYAAMNVLRLKELHEDEILALVPMLRNGTSSSSISVRFFARKALNEVRVAARKFPGIQESLVKLRDRGKALSWQDLLRTVIRCDVEEKLIILDLLKDIDDPQIVPALVAYLKIEDDTFVLAEIIKSIGLLGKESIIPVLKEYLDHKDSRIRSNAAEALNEIGGKAVVEALVPLLDDGDNRVKATVAMIVSQYGDGNVLTTLAEMLHSVEIWMRMSASYALGFIEHQEAVDLLIEALMDVNPEVRIRAIEGLAHLRARKALDFLTRLGSGVETEIQRAADQAIGRIKAQPRDFAYLNPDSELARTPAYTRSRSAPSKAIAATPVNPPEEGGDDLPKRRFNPFGIFDKRDLKKEQSVIDELIAIRDGTLIEMGQKIMKLHSEGQFDRPYFTDYNHELKKLRYLIEQKESHKKEIKQESLRSTFVAFLKNSTTLFTMEKRVGDRLGSLQTRMNDTHARLARRVLGEYKPESLEFIQLGTLPNRVRKLDREIEQLTEKLQNRQDEKILESPETPQSGDDSTQSAPMATAPGDSRTSIDKSRDSGPRGNPPSPKIGSEAADIDSVSSESGPGSQDGSGTGHEPGSA